MAAPSAAAAAAATTTTHLTCSTAGYAKRLRMVQAKDPRHPTGCRIRFPVEVRVLPAGAQVPETSVRTSMNAPFAPLAISGNRLDIS